MTNQAGKAPSAKEAAKHAHEDKAHHSVPEGAQGSAEDLELKKKLAEQVNQGSNLANPVKLGEGMPDLGKGTDAEKNPEAKFLADEDKEEAKSKK